MISGSNQNLSLVKLYLKNSKTMSKHEYLHGTKRIKYFVFRTRRTKTSEIIVDSDEIVIRVPHTKTEGEIESLLKEKISWILKKQKEIIYGKEKIGISKPMYTRDSTLPYLGKNYKTQVKLINSQTVTKKNMVKNFIVHKNDLLLFNILDSQNSSNEIRKLYENWLHHKAKIIFKERVHVLSKIIGMKPNNIVIKNLKNRWASITNNGDININVNLVKAPPEIIDYIIIHELCHFRVKGHSYDYWSLLKRYCPDYPKFIKWLEINGRNLLS